MPSTLWFARLYWIGDQSDLEREQMATQSIIWYFIMRASSTAVVRRHAPQTHDAHFIAAGSCSRGSFDA